MNRQPATVRIVIPARFAATRLPGKPLLDIAGRPMIEHVYRRAAQADVGDVWVATDDARIAEVVHGFGGRAVVTRQAHACGADRIHEVACTQRWPDDDLIINVQGDEPFIPIGVIRQIAANLQRHPEAAIATVCCPFTHLADILDTNTVKVVRDLAGFALYFSRLPIPGGHNPPTAEQLPLYRRHLGIYGYRVNTLRQMAAQPVVDAERRERLEQLRCLALGHRIHCEDATAIPPAGIDTAADLERSRRYARSMSSP